MISFFADYWLWLLAGLAAVAGLVVVAYVTQNWRALTFILPIVGAFIALGRAHRQGVDAERERLARANDAAKRRRVQADLDAERERDEELRKELGRWEK